MVKILEGLRIVEGSAFVAAPLAGMTLAQMGADVIRFDRIRGGLDHQRWPVTQDGKSLFWAGLNKGKRSIAVDMNSPRGQEVITRLICAPGEGKGVFLTNLRVRGWMDYDALKRQREDLIMMSIIGDRHGGPQVDYTVNPAVGFPNVTGPEGSSDPVGHVLPAWDCITGQYAALTILAAERHRRLTGQGQLVETSLKDIALAMVGNLGLIGEVTVNGTDRTKIGNAIYGAYAQDFALKDGERIMVVAITERQWRNLRKATATEAAFAALAGNLGADLDLEGERFTHRHAITQVLLPFFAARTLRDIEAAFDGAGVTWSRFQSFRQLVETDPDCSTDNPLFSMVEQPGLGRYLTPGTPAAFTGFARTAPAPAPRLGEHTDEILTEIGFSNTEIASLHDGGVVAGPA
ncbi:MAG: CoA transferase [Hyphomicrobiales bacterium]